MHHDATTEGDQQIPEIVHYNKTKSDVVNTDHLATIFYIKVTAYEKTIIRFVIYTNHFL